VDEQRERAGTTAAVTPRQPEVLVAWRRLKSAVTGADPDGVVQHYLGERPAYPGQALWDGNHQFSALFPYDRGAAHRIDEDLAAFAEEKLVDGGAFLRFNEPGSHSAP
jgi:hypothetical protein